MTLRIALVARPPDFVHTFKSESILVLFLAMCIAGNIASSATEQPSGDSSALGLQSSSQLSGPILLTGVVERGHGPYDEETKNRFRKSHADIVRRYESSTHLSQDEKSEGIANSARSLAAFVDDKPLTGPVYLWLVDSGRKYRIDMQLEDSETTTSWRWNGSRQDAGGLSQSISRIMMQRSNSNFVMFGPNCLRYLDAEGLKRHFANYQDIHDRPGTRLFTNPVATPRESDFPYATSITITSSGNPWPDHVSVLQPSGNSLEVTTHWSAGVPTSIVFRSFLKSRPNHRYIMHFSAMRQLSPSETLDLFDWPSGTPVQDNRFSLEPVQYDDSPLMTDDAVKRLIARAQNARQSGINQRTVPWNWIRWAAIGIIFIGVFYLILKRQGSRRA